jgi:hypothetical protein
MTHPIMGLEDAMLAIADLQAAVRARDDVIATLKEDAHNLEMELRSKRAIVRKLRQDQDAMRRSDEHYATALDVLDHWQAVCSPKAREPYSPKRLEACPATRPLISSGAATVTP